jgi:hypothetical protein
MLPALAASATLALATAAFGYIKGRNSGLRITVPVQPTYKAPLLTPYEIGKLFVYAFGFLLVYRAYKEVFH